MQARELQEKWEVLFHIEVKKAHHRIPRSGRAPRSVRRASGRCVRLWVKKREPALPAERRA